MPIGKRIAAVSVMLLLVLGMVFGSGIAVSAAETTMVFSAQASDMQTAADSEAQSEEIVLKEMPLAEAKATILQSTTVEKGMPSILGFLLVAVTAAAGGMLVLMRAKLGRKKRGYQPTEDLSFFKLK